MAGDEFEGEEAEAGAGGAGGVEEPEGGGGRRLVKPPIQSTSLCVEKNACLDTASGRS